MSLAQLLGQRALEIIRDPTCWTQWTAARDEQARSVSPRSAEARKFCGFGALARAAQECSLSEWLLSDIFGPAVLTALIRVNDEEDHEAVLACLRELAWKK